MHVHRSRRVQAPDCAAPTGPSNFAAGLIRLSLPWTELPQRRTQRAGTHRNVLSVIKLDVSETEVRSRSPWGLARRWPKSLAVPRTRPQVAMTAAHKRLAAFSPFGWSRHLPRVAADPHVRSGSHIPHRASAATPYRRSAPLVHARPAVDDQGLPGDEIALRRSEENDRADQILRLLHPL